MNLRKMNSDGFGDDGSVIETEFKDVLTGSSCTTLIAELIKYILYHKQQLPYTFDRLKYVITKCNSDESSVSSLKKGSNVERLFRAAEEGLTTLEMLFEKTKLELSDCKSGRVSEIALILGSSPMTPKQVYRIYLPDVYLGHSPSNHPERKNLLQLLQSLIHSSRLTDMLSKPMQPTNMYFLIKKQGNNENLSNWFLPKNRYKIPKSGQQFHIRFRHPNLDSLQCSCQNFTIYKDHPEIEIEIEDKKEESDDNLESETEWYQACAIFKGFKDVFVNGISASDMWLKK